MIIPRIRFSSDFDADQLVDQLTHWSLFGQVALTGVASGHAEQLESVVERIGGVVDLIIELTDPSQQEALTFLNAGTTRIICNPSDRKNLEAVPPNRLIHLTHDGSPDESIPVGYLVALAAPTSDRIAELEMARIDCLVNTTQLTPELIVDFFKTVLVTDRADGLWSTLVVDPLGIALGLAYSNHESLLHAIENRCGTYWSRSRDGLWIKGETSGATQELLEIRMDCDRDCLRFKVTQDPPGFCHRNSHTCFGEERSIQSVMQRLVKRINETDEKSFTRKLANDATMLETKLLEEAQELSKASQTNDIDEIAWEAADVLYFALVAMLRNGVTLDRVYNELARRMNRVVRRENKLEQPKDENGN